MSCSRVGATLLTLGGRETCCFESETVAPGSPRGGKLAECVVADAIGTDLTALDPAQPTRPVTTSQTLFVAIERTGRTLRQKGIPSKTRAHLLLTLTEQLFLEVVAFIAFESAAKPNS